MEYVKLKLIDDWGNLFYLTKNHYDKYQKGEIGYYEGRDYKIHFKEGQTMRIKWPNGNETTERIHLKYHDETISEQGQKGYTVTSKIPFIKIKVQGLESIVEDFSDLEICDEDIILAKEAYKK